MTAMYYNAISGVVKFNRETKEENKGEGMNKNEKIEKFVA